MLNSDAKCSHKKTDEHDEELEEQEQLLESVLDNMDEAEKDQFEGVSAKVKTRKKLAKISRWKKLYKEKCFEEEAAQLGLVMFSQDQQSFFIIN